MKAGLFDWLYLAGFVLFSLVRVRGVGAARRSSGETQRPRLRADLDTLFTLLQSLGLFFLPVIYLFSDWLDWANYTQPAGLAWLGVPIYLLGIWMLWRTHRDLGANWSDSLEVRPQQSLVTDGIYRRIRHPMYTAHLVAALAQCLLLGNWIAGPSFLLLQLPFYWYRIPREEQSLLAHFGSAYRDYMRLTGRLFPRRQVRL